MLDLKNRYRSKDCSALRDRLSKLYRLTIRAPHVSFSYFSEFKNIRALDLSFSAQSQLSQLADLLFVDELYLSNMDLLNIEFVRNLPQIKKLILYHNPLWNLEPLSVLKNLKELNIAETMVQDISVLKQHNKLEFLSIFDYI